MIGTGALLLVAGHVLRLAFLLLLSGTVVLLDRFGDGTTLLGVHSPTFLFGANLCATLLELGLVANLAFLKGQITQVLREVCYICTSWLHPPGVCR